MHIMHNPAHPGEVLKEALEGRSITDVARHIGVTRVALSRVLNCKAGVSPEMSIKLAQALGTSADLWFKMQCQYDFWQAAQKKRKKIKPLAA
ncbi:MAG: HigA family addiction module antitoxin [Acidobacteriaceae bacterium]